MNAQDLKNSILQLAVQGKLVPQDPADEPASELLKRIRKEKERLIKEGKLRKEKPLPTIGEDEIPFDIPETWEWVRLKDIVYNFGQKKPDKTFCYIDVGSIDNTNGSLDHRNTIIEPDKAPSRARKIAQKGAVLYSCVRPYLLNICIVDREFPHEPIASTAFAVLMPFKGVLNTFLFYYLRSPAFVSYTNEVSTGMAYPAINDESLYRGLVPLPPIAEQARIVAKIEELLPKIAEYGEAQERLTELNAVVPEQLRRSILQQAVQGKLTDRDPSDEPASLLLDRIRAEKARLIAEGKIRKEKPLPPIGEDEIPFDIPDTWQWVRMGEISSSNIGLTYTPKDVVEGEEGTIVLRSSNIQNGKMDYSDIVRVKIPIPESRMCNVGDVIICARNGSRNLVGKSAIVDRPGMAFGAFMAILRSPCNSYLNMVINSYYFRRTFLYDVGTSTINQITQSMLQNFIIPLPPLAEQARIVERVETLLSACDRLK